MCVGSTGNPNKGASPLCWTPTPSEGREHPQLRPDSSPSAPLGGRERLQSPLPATLGLDPSSLLEALRSESSHSPGQVEQVAGFSAKATTWYLWGWSCLGCHFLFAGPFVGFWCLAFPAYARMARQAPCPQGREDERCGFGSPVTHRLALCVSAFAIWKGHRF